MDALGAGSAGPPGQLLGRLGQAPFVGVGDDDRRALLEAATGGGGANPCPCCGGDDHHFVVQEAVTRGGVGAGVGHGLLADKVVIVTAAAGTGIGSATARRCLEEGAAVIISDAHERRLAETAEQLAAKDGPAGADGAERVHAIACNVTDEVQVRTLYAGAVEHFGRIDVAVHNAGLGGTVPLVDMTDEQWSTVLDIR